MRVQLEVAVRRLETIWTGAVKQGDTIWVADEKAARHLLEAGVCRFINWKEDAVKSEDAAPAEVAQEPAPKSAGDRTAGHLIDLQSLRRSGPGVLSSQSAAALVSPKRI